MNEQATPSFTISSGVMLAAAYIVMGKLGLMLAVPPGYASGIFPPAGLAIALFKAIEDYAMPRTEEAA